MHKRTAQNGNSHVSNENDDEDESYPMLAFQPNNLSISLPMPINQQQQKLKQDLELASGDYDMDVDPLSSNHNHQHPTLDKKRAPKLAACLFLTFFTLAGFDHAKRHYRSSSHDAVLTNATDTTIHYPSPIQLEPLPPNLDNQGNPIQIPHELSNLADITPLKFNSHSNRNEIPLFWHIPRTGGSTFKDIFAFCLRLTVASEVGGSYVDPRPDDEEDEDRLSVVVDADTGAKFLNVDTTSLDGIARASELRLSSYLSPDLVAVTPYLLPAVSGIFRDGPPGGRRALLFTVVRHPIERAVSMYYYLAATQPALLGNGGVTSLEEYVRSDLVENNWMTRFLVGQMGGELGVEDEARAKEVLKMKCLVGLLSRKAESFSRFEAYFGWELGGGVENGIGNGSGNECVDRLLNWDWSGKNRHEALEEGSEAWDLLRDQNAFDLRLHEYAKMLFEHQGEIFVE